MGVFIPNRHLFMGKFLRRLDPSVGLSESLTPRPGFLRCAARVGNWEGGLGCYYSEQEVSIVMLSDAKHLARHAARFPSPGLPVGGLCLGLALVGCNASPSSGPLITGVESTADSQDAGATITPSQRGGAPAVWLAAQRKMVLFGGMLPITADTLEFDAAAGTWRRLTPESDGPVPPARCHHTFVSDVGNESALLFGGFSFAGRFNDLWRFDPLTSRWAELQPTGTPPAPRCLHTAAHIASGNEMLVYGGISGSGVFASDFFDDTHLYDIRGNRWIALDVTGPGKLSGALTFYSAREDAVFLWGGKQVTSFPTRLWRFDVARRVWEAVETAVETDGETPIGREDPTWFWDEARQILLIFSGRNDTVAGTLLDDAYELDVATRQWRRIDAAGAPPPRWRASVVFDAETGQGWVFGGWRDFDGRDAFNDTWRLDSADGVWTRLGIPG